MDSQLHLNFLSLTEDILIDIISLLKPPEIHLLGQTCKYLQRLVKVRLVWVHASKSSVLSRGFPFPNTNLDDMPTAEIIASTTRGYTLGHRWLSGVVPPRDVRTIAGTSANDVRFLPGHGGRFLAIISKSLWNVLSVWDIVQGTRVAQWSPRGAIFTGFALNDDAKSPNTIAVTLYLAEQQFVKVFRFDGVILTELYSMDTTMTVVTFSGDVVALSDTKARTLIWNCKDNTHALLESHADNSVLLQYNVCNQVLFAHNSVFVARARTVHLFRYPCLLSPTTSPPPVHEAIAQHSFGWVDSHCMTICPYMDTSGIYMLVRGEVDDPWASNVHNLELYVFDHDPASDSESPYRFPPRLSERVASLRGALQCKYVVLGRLGTALWMQPRDHTVAGLVVQDESQRTAIPGRSATCETLVAAIFPGSLNTTEAVAATLVYENQPGSSWSSFDYDEVGGRVALSSTYGPVEILYL